MKPLLWILVPAIVLLALVAGIWVCRAATQDAADEWLARGRPHPIYGITTYGPIFPWHRDKMIAILERNIPRIAARVNTHGSTPTRWQVDDQQFLEDMKKHLASLNAGKVFYTEGGSHRRVRDGPRYAVQFNAELMFDGSENPVPLPIRGFGVLWAWSNTTVTVNIAIPY